MKVVKHGLYQSMYRIQYSKGVVSDNFWNLTRAKDIIRNYGEYLYKEELSNRMTLFHARKPVQKSLGYESYMGSQGE